MSSSTQLGEDDYENIRKIPDLYPIEYEPILDELKSMRQEFRLGERNIENKVDDLRIDVSKLEAVVEKLVTSSLKSLAQLEKFMDENKKVKKAV
jgi:hypothetical protein